MKHKILLIGSGGHCKVILDTFIRTNEFKVAGIIDRNERVGGEVFGVPVIGVDRDLRRLFKSGIKYCFISIGSVGNPRLRVKLYNIAKMIGFEFPNLISPDAIVSSHAILGEGNFIAPGAVINARTRIGNNCIINTGAIVEHDCVIGDFAHISPGAVLSGSVDIGNGSHIGSGSVVIHNISIGENAVIGAGSVVTKNIRKGALAYGNPCRERKRNA